MTVIPAAPAPNPARFQPAKPSPTQTATATPAMTSPRPRVRVRVRVRVPVVDRRARECDTTVPFASVVGLWHRLDGPTAPEVTLPAEYMRKH
ncbi:hypothetical protein E3O59_18440 [Cryobacterium sp. MDB2-33-2]|nr:hypothetical protein E3O59_18440 [Cryobacterium sp. MDB2-33-2]